MNDAKMNPKCQPPIAIKFIWNTRVPNFCYMSTNFEQQETEIAYRLYFSSILLDSNLVASQD